MRAAVPGDFRPGVGPDAGRVGVAPESAGRRGRGWAEVDPEGEDPVVDDGLGVTDHGEVHEVDLGLLLESLAVGALDGWQAPGPHCIRPGPDALHHGLGVEFFGHGVMVPAQQSRYE